MMEGALLAVMIVMMVLMCGGMIFGGIWVLARRRNRPSSNTKMNGR